MASKVSGVIEKINVSGTERAIASTAYGYCETAASTAAKVVDMTDFKLHEGVTIHVKFKEKNSAASPTLNVQGTGAKPIVQYGTTAASTADETSGWYAGAVLTLTYDGTSWVRDQGFNTNTNTWRGVENSLTSDSTSVSLSAAQGKVLKGLIDAMDATTPAASGNATAFIDSITQTDGKITSITKKNIPTVSSSTAGLAPKGAAVSTQSTSTRFLREDGTWAAPSYTWKQNTSSQEGYVTSSSGQYWKNWGTGSTDTPSWTYPYEGSLHWGGPNYAGGISFAGYMLNDKMRGNKFAALSADSVTIEYSPDGGSTWTDYGASNPVKRAMFTQGTSIRLVPSGNVNDNSQMRIIVNTGVANVYTVLKKFLIYVSTSYSNRCWVTIDAALESSPNNYSKVICNKAPISGWSGWNEIQCDCITYGNTPSSQYGRIRFTFGHNSITAGKEIYGLSILNIRGYGGVGWVAPSALAAYDRPYSYNETGAVNFMNTVTASGFNGPLTGNVTGNATSATTAGAFSSGTTVKLTGDTTGESASSTKGWSLITTTNKMSATPASTLNSQAQIDDFLEASKLKYGLFKTTDANNVGMASNDGLLISMSWGSTTYGAQLAFDDVASGVMKFRGKATNWGDWRTVAHSGNVSTGDNDGQIKIAGINVSVKGLAALAYKASLTASDVGLGNVENTKLSTWAGSANITTVGTISTGTWHGTKIANDYIANPKVTIAGNVVNLGESLPDSTLRESLGLSKALRFVGVTTTDMTGGTATNHSWTGTPAGISNYTPKQGDVVINSTKQDEWVCTSVSGTTYTWERLGSDTSYKIVQSAVSDPTASTSASTTFIDTISQNANGVITATKKTLPTASSTVAGITKVGASGGAAAYSHTHSYLANTNTGAADRPIYITGNAAAQTTYRMAGTNVGATAGLTYSNDLDTGIWYVNGISGTDKTTLYNQSDGVIIANKYSNSWISEIYQDYRTGQLAIRGKNNGTWAAWRNVLDSTNYTDYTVTKTGTGASGTWGISITGSAGSVAWANVSDHPTKLSQFTNDSGYITSYTETDPTVPAWAKAASKPSYTASEVGALPSSTTVTNVKISADTTTNKNYALVFGTTPSDGTTPTGEKTEGLQKNISKLYVNPSTGNIQATTFNGYTLAAASAKGVVTTIDTSANLPTSNAVKTFVEGKGYVTSSGVTSVATGVGLTGGTITGTGTIKAYLKSETKATYDSATVTNTSGRQYAITPDKTGYLSVNVPWTDTNNAVTHTLKTTTQFYITGTESNTASTGGDTFDTGIYATTVAGQLNATTYKVNEAVILKYNPGDSSLEFVF